MSLNAANKIAAFCASQYGHPLCPIHGAVNIVYIEGLNPDGSPNADEPNKWNDLRLLLTFADGDWKMVHNATATTEPGDYYTKNPTNKKGCARIAFGYHPPAWKLGFHKGVQPALVQVGQIKIHRDLNRDGLRNRTEEAFMSEILKDKNGNEYHIGLNHHTTNKSFKGELVGKHSAGCLVGKLHPLHMVFLEMLKRDVRIVAGRPYLYDTWVLPGDKFNQFKFEI